MPDVPNVSASPGPACTTLSFKQYLHEQTVDKRTYRVLTPVPVIDGVELFGDKSPVVDAFGLLAHGPVPAGVLDLCTCTCGVPDCAGFFEPVALVEDPVHGTVTWQVPAEGYDKLVAPSFGPGPWAFTFEREAYARVLRALELSILARVAADPFMELSPFDIATLEGADPEGSGELGYVDGAVRLNLPQALARAREFLRKSQVR